MHPQRHDIDDLFRRAAARYPLNTGNGDWEMVSQKLGIAGRPGINKAYYRERKYYALLLLIPFAFLFHNSFRSTHTTNHTGKSSLYTAAEKKPVKKATAPKVQYEKAIAISGKPEIVPPHKSLTPSLPKRVGIDVTIGIREISFPKSEERPKQTQKPVSRHNGFYLGAIGGLDFGSVKGQRFTDAGYNLGLLAGYRFNKHWSIETGISWITKKYFTRGEHFSTKKIEDNMPGGMEMMAVNGRLSLLEIPYKLKYDFLLKERSNFFITAGASTNIYIKEDNEYHTRLNGIPDMQKASYRDFHCAPLCLMHVSAGYEHIFRNKNRLRFEPYLKFPLRKVGMGSVPVFSVGLNVSISDFY